MDSTRNDCSWPSLHVMCTTTWQRSRQVVQIGLENSGGGMMVRYPSQAAGQRINGHHGSQSPVRRMTRR